MSEQNKTLYERLGGYDAIAAVANDLLPRLHNYPQLGQDVRQNGTCSHGGRRRRLRRSYSPEGRVNDATNRIQKKVATRAVPTKIPIDRKRLGCS